MHLELANPQYLWLFLLYIPIIVWYIVKQRKAYPSMGLSSTVSFAHTHRSFRQVMRHLLIILRLGAIGCLIIILCRPQSFDNWHKSWREGTDIEIVLDVSTSMLAADLKPNRLDAAKNVAVDFINGREYDNIGLTIFAGESLGVVPLSSNRSAAIDFIKSYKLDLMGDGRGQLIDGTAIGDGIATGVNRIKDGMASSKSIILITDGTYNAGNIAPLTAAQLAQQQKIRIYTIGVGTMGNAPVPTSIDPMGRIVYTNLPVTIDSVTLKSIADMTGGKYFRATDNNVLQNIFDQINDLETTKLETFNHTHAEDDYWMWAWLAFGLFALEIVLRQTLFRTLP